MRRKISKRKRRDAIKSGLRIVSEQWVRKTGWARKDIGFSISGEYEGYKITCSGFDELEAYSMLLDFIKDEEMVRWITKNVCNQDSLEILT